MNHLPLTVSDRHTTRHDRRYDIDWMTVIATLVIFFITVLDSLMMKIGT